MNKYKTHNKVDIAAIQQFRTAISGWLSAKKSYVHHPEKFTGEPKKPQLKEYGNTIIFKQKAIRVKGRKLMLSLRASLPPITTEWNSKLGTPICCYKLGAQAWAMETMLCAREKC